MAYITKVYDFTDLTDFTISVDGTSADTIAVDTGSAVLTTEGKAYAATNPEGIYITSNAITTDGLSSISAASTPESGISGSAVKYTIFADGVEWYWNVNVGEWREATDYTTSNTAAELSAHFDAFKTGETFDFQIRAYFVVGTSFTDGPTLETITVKYDFAVKQGTVDYCYLYGWYLESNGNPVSGAAVTCVPQIGVGVNNVTPGVTGVASVKTSTVATTTNDEGYWEVRLIRTIDGAQIEVEVTVGDRTPEIIQLPDLDSVQFESYLTTP